jgi:mevalonate kinase
MNYNQMLLSGLFLSTPEIERACAVARDAGALGAKLTGAGGGGAVIALCEADPEPIVSALTGAGFQAFSSSISARVPGAGA